MKLMRVRSWIVNDEWAPVGQWMLGHREMD